MADISLFLYRSSMDHWGLWAAHESHTVGLIQKPLYFNGDQLYRRTGSYDSMVFVAYCVSVPVSLGAKMCVKISDLYLQARSWGDGRVLFTQQLYFSTKRTHLIFAHNRQALGRTWRALFPWRRPPIFSSDSRALKQDTSGTMASGSIQNHFTLASNTQPCKSC